MARRGSADACAYPCPDCRSRSEIWSGPSSILSRPVFRACREASNWPRRDVAYGRMLTLLLAVGALVTLFVVGASGEEAASASLPPLGRDTVLVWTITGPTYEKSMVARLASFAPERYLEWEDESGQGTLLLTERSLREAGGYEISSLLVNGLEKKSDKATTLWLSRRVFTEVRDSEKKSAKLRLNGLPAKFTLAGRATIAVTVNGSVRELPVIRLTDGREAEWWFLDDVTNPLLARYMVRTHSQTLSSVTTNQPDTLRWIKGRKLPH